MVKETKGVQIESYEPYHIGIKLDADINLERLKSKIKGPLKEKEYKIREEVLLVEPRVTAIAAKEILGIKDNVRVELNFIANALNIIGEKPEKVIKIFKEISNILPEMGYNTSIAVSFYEIIMNATLKSDKNPIEMIANSTKLNLESLSARAVAVDGLKLSNKSKKEMKDQLTELFIEPSPISPNDRFSINFLYRSKEKEEVELFHNKISDVVIKIIQSLGGE